MTMTGLDVFDTTLQKTHIWLNEIADELDWEERFRAYKALRAGLHALRDRLTVEEAAHLGAQLPISSADSIMRAGRPLGSPTESGIGTNFSPRFGNSFGVIPRSIPSAWPERSSRC
jgi:uncharacterized protein (DUF2267 family)